MYNHLAGKLIEKNPAYVVIECGGIGFHINISLYTYSNLGDEEYCRLFTHLQITEDAQTLWGFADEDERRLFKQLISVSGVGCNTARMMLSSMSPVEIQDAIMHEDVSRLKSIKGIGEKTAQRILIDLKSKVKKEGVTMGGLTSQLKVKQEAIAALTSLGFAKPSVEKVIDTLAKNNDSNVTVETLIKSALKTL
jgi:holliday junction DNA helicase RuvA